MTHQEMETLLQQWLMVPRTRQPEDNKVIRPPHLFHYVGGYRIGDVNLMVRVLR